MLLSLEGPWPCRAEDDKQWPGLLWWMPQEVNDTEGQRMAYPVTPRHQVWMEQWQSLWNLEKELPKG
jgi:hypothetical protein